MKNYLKSIAILLFTVLFQSILAANDGGDCARFYGKFKLINGEIIEGYVHSQRVDFDKAKKDFKHFLFYTYGDVKYYDSLMVYFEIDTLKAIGQKKHRPHCDFFYFACPIEKTRMIVYDEIVEATMLEKYPCESCNQKAYPYSSGGYSPVVITELTKDEIRKLKDEIPVNIGGVIIEELSGVSLINYNANYTQLEVEQLYTELATRLDYEEIKQELSKLNIIIFMISVIA